MTCPSQQASDHSAQDEIFPDFYIPDDGPATAIKSTPTISNDAEKLNALDLANLTGLADNAPEALPEPALPALDRLKVEFSAFPRKTYSKAKPLILSMQAFIDLLATHHVRTNKDGKMFAPATFTGTRTKNNFISASGVCLDFDHGQPNIGSVLEVFPGTLAAFYSTHSHTPENPRFRVVMPLSRPVSAEDHARLVSGITSLIPTDLMECLDPTCFERARSHYLPSCPPEHKCHAFTGHQDGEPVDVERFLSMGDAVVSETNRIKLRPALVQAEPHPPAPKPIVTNTFGFIDTTTGEVVNLTTWAAQNPCFDILEAVDQQYFRGTPTSEGKQHIACPFEDQHTDQGEDMATFIANASPPQHIAWDIHCCHAHCVKRDRLEFVKAMLEKGWIPFDVFVTGIPKKFELRRPLYVTYQTNEILAAPAWTALRPNERRIALDLMTMCWAEIDGMIADDDWAIARRLDMPTEDWLPYRETLSRTGWMIKVGARLTNSIVKREFENAQKAYMDSITYGSMGGRISAAKKKNK